MNITIKASLLIILINAFFSYRAIAGVSIIDKSNGVLELTDNEAAIMTQLILEAPVKVNENSFELIITTRGKDFNGNRRTFTTGKIVCLKNGSNCTVKGSEIREAGDGWFSPKQGIARVFGMGKLAALENSDSLGFFHCKPVYENIACDFKLK